MAMVNFSVNVKQQAWKRLESCSLVPGLLTWERDSLGTRLVSFPDYSPLWQFSLNQRQVNLKEHMAE